MPDARARVCVVCGVCADASIEFVLGLEVLRGVRQDLSQATE